MVRIILNLSILIMLATSAMGCVANGCGQSMCPTQLPWESPYYGSVDVGPLGRPRTPLAERRAMRLTAKCGCGNSVYPGAVESSGAGGMFFVNNTCPSCQPTPPVSGGMMHSEGMKQPQYFDGMTIPDQNFQGAPQMMPQPSQNAPVPPPSQPSPSLQVPTGQPMPTPVPGMNPMHTPAPGSPTTYNQYPGYQQPANGGVHARGAQQVQYTY
ncbi:hypothetical protein SH668x_002759 [Planctomicrobium sp. SH668]|uniref:hypothetical protein n=1 Tax=Planctomicrobium sp. SH668 TaxID=3448126 RepID=UPI003F5BD33B